MLAMAANLGTLRGKNPKISACYRQEKKRCPAIFRPYITLCLTNLAGSVISARHPYLPVPALHLYQCHPSPHGQGLNSFH